jgi:hypothetical protein
MNTTAGLTFAAGTITALGQLARGDGLQPRTIIATGILGVLMLSLESVNRDLARGIAAIVLTTAVLTSGADVAEGINRTINRPTTTQ